MFKRTKNKKHSFAKYYQCILTNNICSLPKIDMIIHYILQHKLDMSFITETWISKNEDQYIKVNLMTQGSTYYHVKGKTEKEVSYASKRNNLR